MATTGSVALANEIRALYDADYYMAGQANTFFDQFSNPKAAANGVRGSTLNFPILESGQPASAPLDELSDVVPQQMRVAEAIITLGEYGGAVEVTKFASATSYADIYEQAAFFNGYSMAESVDNIVRAVAGQGSRQFFQNNRTARTAFAGQATAADRITPAFIEFLSVLMARGSRMPLYEDGSVCTVMHPFVFFDLLQASDPRAMAIRVAPELLFNGELAYWGGMRIVVSSNAKAFWGAGAVATTSFSSTLAAAASPGDTNLKVTATTNLAVGDWMAIIDAAETGNTWSDTNEIFRVTTVGTSGSGGTGIDGFCLDPGPGDNGGVRYAHASGTTVNDNNSVYPIPVLGPNSITKYYSDLTGPWGETLVVGPLDRLGRFKTLGWYLIAGWGRARNVWLLRGEVGSATS